MLNKLQAIIKNMIIMVYCLARSKVGVRGPNSQDNVKLVNNPESELGSSFSSPS